ncbi:hypothetical protein T4D_9704 [Trichinella pseudospiralis]|uniref:Uncharacterized protein n=1 Tax=Trichinella pseudospiralis TaxID=6337 RepID=A0A0V1FFX2_TRIPS|nr:hypothetical protein T4D_9704 [Trichinella pseudospiralis]
MENISTTLIFYKLKLYMKLKLKYCRICEELAFENDKLFEQIFITKCNAVSQIHPVSKRLGRLTGCSFSSEACSCCLSKPVW